MDKNHRRTEEISHTLLQRLIKNRKKKKEKKKDMKENSHQYSLPSSILIQSSLHLCRFHFDFSNHHSFIFPTNAERDQAPPLSPSPQIPV